MPTAYLKRLAVMLFLAMPFTAIGVAAAGYRNDDQRIAGFATTLGQAFGLVYIWGIVTGIVLSLVHTAVMRSLGGGSLSRSVAIGGGLGALLGAATPTLFTGFLHPPVVVAGTFAGLIYAVVVALLFRCRRRGGAART